MTPPDTGGARIHDQGYRPFDGPLLSVRTRFAAIAANELRQAWKSRWVRRLIWAAFFPLGVFSVLVFVSARMESILGPIRVWPHFWRVQLFFGMLAIFFVGRRAVGEDLRSGAMALYFSRAVDFRQYLLGKWLAVAAAVGLVVLAPGIVLALFRVAIDPAAGALDGLAWIGALAVLAAALSVSGGMAVLALSSVAGRGRSAGIAWVLTYFLSSAAGLALASATGVDALTAVAGPDAEEQQPRPLETAFAAEHAQQPDQVRIAVPAPAGPRQGVGIREGS